MYTITIFSAFLFAFALNANVQSASLVNKDIEPRSEDYWFCGILRPITGFYFIRDAQLSWGKWVNCSTCIDEIATPKDRYITVTTPIEICSRGRLGTPTGTEGFAILNETSLGSELKLWWDIPYFGSNKFGLDYDSNLIKITANKLGETYYEYTIENK